MFGSRLLLVLLLACLTVGASAPPVSRLSSPSKWKDPLAFPAPASSSERKALLDQAHRATKTVPADIKKSIAASKAKIDQQVLTERAQALHQLGIKTDGVGYLTILVSASMPQVMLNGYAQSAVWAGGVVAFRGVEPGHDIPWFITHVMHALVRLGASPSITLDPRVFSAYGVDAVPAIVYSTVPPGTICAEQVVKTIQRSKKPPLEYHDCAPADPADYWKMTGAVSVAYALRQFADAGAPEAKRLLRAVQADPLTGTGRQPLTLDAHAYAQATGPGSIADVMQLMNAAPPSLPFGSASLRGAAEGEAPSPGLPGR